MTMDILNQFIHITFNFWDIEVLAMSDISNLWRHIAQWELNLLGIFTDTLLHNDRVHFIVSGLIV